MNARMEEIMNAIEHNKLTADDPFRFHCTQCGKCCINREDILLTPLDLFRIANELKLSLKEFIGQYCELYIGPDSHFPIIRLKPRGSIKRCPLLKNRRCSVHKAKPAMCAMFPIGRVIAFPEDGTSSNAPVIEYFYMNPGCGNNTRTQTIREWFDSFGIPLDDDFFIEWATFQKNFVMLIRETERLLGESAMRQIWSPIFGILYLCYDLEKEFLPQFRENAEKLLRGLQMIAGTKTT